MTTLERTPTSREQAQSGEQTQPRLAQRDTPQPPTARLHRDALRQAELEQARAKGRHAAEREQLRWITAVAGALFVVAAITGSGALLGGGVIIVEGLTNLDRLQTNPVRFTALPLKLKRGDGSPARAFAVDCDKVKGG